MIEKKLRVKIALSRRQGKPPNSGFLILGNVSSHQIQLAEGILRILVSLF